jgi:glutathione synthase/RimK-type ligase-like ATP-grasp enzyme
MEGGGRVDGWMDGGRDGGMEEMEQKVNRNKKGLYVQTYIEPTKQNDKNLIGNGKKPACKLAGGLGLQQGQWLCNLR